MKSFIVDLGAKIFGWLRCNPLFHPIRKIFPSATATYGFVEIWVLSNLICSLIFLSISSCSNILWWEIIFLSYAGIRIFAIVIEQINVLLFDQYRSKKAGKTYDLGSYERIIILLLVNYSEILVWFALFYRNLHFMFKSKDILLSSFSGSLYFSLVTMSTLGYGDITPIKSWGQILVIAQTLIGLFMVLVILARFISLLPKPGIIGESEKDEESGSQGNLAP